MPRDGLQQYAPPPGTDGIVNYTVESARYNGFVHDITSDQNNPRPIVSGGTGANNARDAMINLKGEVADQAVDNYDMFPFLPGSFVSLAGATGAPVAGHVFKGICYGQNGTAQVLEAFDFSDANVPHTKWFRAFNGTTWSAWAQGAPGIAGLDATYVNIVGDTMTGRLAFNGATYIASISFTETTTGGHKAIRMGASNKLEFLDSTETIIIATIDDAGSTFIGGTLSIKGTAIGLNGVQLVTSAGNYVSLGDRAGNAAIIIGVAPDAANYYRNIKHTFQTPAGAATLATIDAAGVTVSTTGAFGIGTSVGSGVITDGTNALLRVPAAGGAAYIQNKDGNTYGFFNTSGLTVYNNQVKINTTPGGNAQVAFCDAGGTPAGYAYWAVATATMVFQNNIATNSITLAPSGGVQLGNGWMCKAGMAGAYAGNFSNTFYSAGTLHMWVDTTDFGYINFTSDYRIKKDVIDLDSMWDTVKALRPIKYTQAEFSTPSHIAHQATMAKQQRELAQDNRHFREAELPVGPLFPADDIERWGFIAHELQETLVPSAATGVKDQADAIQSPNPFTIIAALTKALQEAMARIEALEGGAARR
jgi:hypothetical protein